MTDPPGPPAPRTAAPDVTAVIREVTSRPGWTSGNALALIITGTGHRTAEAFESGAATAPLLHIDFQ